MLVGEDALEDKKLFAATMRMFAEIGLRGVSNDRRGAGDFLANPVQHLPVNTGHG